MPAMVLARKFTQAEDNDYERLVAASGRLRAILDAFAEGSLPPEYDAARIGAYAASLIAVQRQNGSFSSSKSPELLEGDERTDALRFVTWVSLALLNRFRNRYPDEAAGIEGLNNAITRVLESPGIADMSFPESGPAEIVQQVELAFILSAGDLPEMLKADKSVSPELSVALETLSETFRRRLAEGETRLPGGIDYTPFIQQARDVLG